MKIQLFIFGLFAVTTLAQDESENGTESTHFRRRIRPTDDTENSSNNTRTRMLQADSSTLRNNPQRHQHFRHNVEWHRRHGIPLPNERNRTMFRNDEEMHHQFRHNVEWHRRHEIPFHSIRNHTTVMNDDEEEEGRQRFLHNPEWHRRHRIPIPGHNDNDDDGHRDRSNFTTVTPTSTKRTLTTPSSTTTTRRAMTTPSPTTTTRRAMTTTTTSPPATTRRATTTPRTTKSSTTTPDPEYSREM